MNGVKDKTRLAEKRCTDKLKKDKTEIKIVKNSKKNKRKKLEKMKKTLKSILINFKKQKDNKITEEHTI